MNPKTTHKDILFILFAAFFISSMAVGQNINRPNISGPGELSVNSYTGGLFHQRTDLHIPGRGLPLDLTFYYNSNNTELDYGYGRGWSMTYTMLCKPQGAEVVVRHSDGRIDLFAQSGSDYIAPSGIFDSLVQYQPGKFVLTDKGGTKYFFDDPSHHLLTSIVDPNSNAIQISYTDSLPTSVMDASGRIVNLSYTNGHLTKVTDPNSLPPRDITYINDIKGNPVNVTDPIGNSVAYQYDNISNMTRRTDQTANQFNIYYNDCVHVTGISSSLNSINLSYDTTSLTTTVSMLVSGQPQITTYKYDINGNLIEKNGTCCGYHQLYQYDSMKNMIQRTDANGNIWNYTYDARGNKITETDPLFGVTTYAYEPIHNRIISITDKRGFVTTYTYDPNGNLIQINRPLGITESFTYDVFGQEQTYVDGRGFTTTFSFNSNGDRIGSQYPDGSTAQWMYDNVGNRTMFIDEDGHPTSYIYDPMNRLVQVTDAMGNINTYNYDPKGNNIAISDALGRTTSAVYDALNRKTSVTTPKGTSFSTFDEAGNRLSSTDPMGNVTQYFYNSQNLVGTVTNAIGASRFYGYDANGNKTSETDFNGNITLYAYDPLNRMIQQTDALSHNTVYGYDASGNRTTVTDANGNTTTYVYDGLNRNTQVQRPIGTTTYAYDANGNKITTVNANGNNIQYTYDSRNRLTAVTDPLAHTMQYVYDAHGNQISFTDRNGLATTYVYDALNRVISETNAAGEMKTYNYDPVGNKISESHPNGNIVTYIFDNGDRIISVSDLEGNGGSATYNAVDNMLTQSDGLGHTVTHSYDVLNRRISTQDAMGNSTTFVYDNNSNLISSLDRNGHTTNFTYDALNRKLTTVQPSGRVTTNTYDNVGNALTLTDDKGNVTTYAYDANNRLISETYPDGTSRSYAYDPLGNKISRTDNNGAVTNLIYDAANRLTSRDYPGSNDDLMTYDFEGRLLTANNTNANISFTYDNANRLLSENLNGRITQYSYNVPGRKTTLTYPGGRVIEENYDLRNRMSSVDEGGLPLASYIHDASNRLASRNYRNGTGTTYAYNSNDWVTSINHSKSPVSFAQINYTFDNEGNRLTAEKIYRPISSEQYVYDQDYKNTVYKEGTLLGGNIPAPVTQSVYNYDGAGNRTSLMHDALPTNYVTNNVNQYVNYVDSFINTPNYDANGNMVTDGGHVYQYDFENRIISVDGGSVAFYKYDALGRRIQKITPSQTINYYFDGQRAIEERDVANIVVATYVFGRQLDEIISMRRAGTDFYYHQNSLGSIIAVTNNAGAVVERYEYDAFGIVTFYNPAFVKINATNIGNRILFNSREYDSETRTYYYRARSYNPKLGRFMQRDPLGYTDGVNVYEYCLSNPQNKIDPLGLESCSPKDFGCTKLNWKKTFVDKSDVPLGALGPFIIKGSLKVEGEFDSETCTHCCKDCSIKEYGYISLTVTADASVSATAGWKIFELEFYGKMHASGKGKLEYDLCKKEKGDLCVDLKGSITVGVRASASIVIATVYAGGEATGTCTYTICVSGKSSGPSCSLSGRLYVGYTSWFGDDEWDIWKSR